MPNLPLSVARDCPLWQSPSQPDRVKGHHMKTIEFKDPKKPATPDERVRSSKTIVFKDPKKPATPDERVRSTDTLPEQRPPAPAQLMKRFTIDVPLDLHSRIKVACATRGLKMADVIRDLLERDFLAPSPKRKSAKS
jgi:hypothetical protein